MHEQWSHSQYRLPELAVGQETNNEARLWVDGFRNPTVHSIYFHLSLLFEKGRLPGTVYYICVMGTMMAPMT